MAMRLNIVCFSLFFVFYSNAFAAGGSISGRVVAKGDNEGEPLVGASVSLQGTVRGTTTNSKGEFRIADISAGKYTLIFSMVGYQRETRSDVLVEEARETVVNVAMIQTPIQTEQIVVTASKREQSLQEVPVSISVADATEMRFRNSQTLEDAVRYVPGVNITGGQINIRGSSGYSRGVGSRVMLLLDGVPFIAGDTGELVFESIPVGQVDRIEVVKGASSALYGSSALGGVVNVITKSIPEIPETDIRTYVGLYNKPSFDKWKWSDKDRFFNGFSISHARRVGDLGVALFFSRQFDDGYRQNDYRRRYNFYLKMKEDLSSTNSLTLNFGLLHQYGGQYVYWRSLEQALLPPVIQVKDNVRSVRYYVSGLYHDALTENLLFTAKLIWNHNDWGYETFNANGESVNRVGRTESSSESFRTEAGATWLVDKDHSLTFGFNGQLDLVSSDLFDDRSGRGIGLYGQDEWKITDQITATLGARFDLQSLGLTETGPQFNPKLAFAYTPIEGTTLRTSFGRGFRIPSIAESFISAEVTGLATLPNKDLEPERSYSYEVGVSQLLGDFGTLDVAAFRSDYDNLIEPKLFVNTAGDTLYVQWQNITKARIQGFETSLKLGLFDGNLLYNLGYTYVYPEDQSPIDSLVPRPNNILPYRPRHIFYTNLLGRFGVLRAGVDFRYISRIDRVYDQFLRLIPDADERVEIVVTDFRIGADFTSLGVPLSAMLNINNAFRYNYLELTANVSPPRNFVLVLEARL